MIKKSKVLEIVEKKIVVKSATKFQPKDYFKTRDGLYIWSSFEDRILSKAKSIKTSKPFKLISFELKKDLSDEEIEKELPKKHIFSETDVCAVVAELINKQAKGEKGLLFNNGYANLFYTGAFVVGVRWGDDEWGVRAWGRDGLRWYSDDRVFSPAN